jgi:hypothetical protein
MRKAAAPSPARCSVSPGAAQRGLTSCGIVQWVGGRAGGRGGGSRMWEALKSGPEGRALCCAGRARPAPVCDGRGGARCRSRNPVMTRPEAAHLRHLVHHVGAEPPKRPAVRHQPLARLNGARRRAHGGRARRRERGRGRRRRRGGAGAGARAGGALGEREGLKGSRNRQNVGAARKGAVGAGGCRARGAGPRLGLAAWRRHRGAAGAARRQRRRRRGRGADRRGAATRGRTRRCEAGARGIGGGASARTVPGQAHVAGRPASPPFCSPSIRSSSWLLG